MDIMTIQNTLRHEQLDGWLITDFQNTNIPALQCLNLDPHRHATRRWFYFIPADGNPVRLVHAIEPHLLDQLPGDHQTYFGWKQRDALLASILPSHGRIAMEYSPYARIPSASRVDGGTLDLIRSLGVTIVSSADLLQSVTARWTPESMESHHQAAAFLRRTIDEVWEYIGQRLRTTPPTEYDIQQFILTRFHAASFQTDSPPICAVGVHSADPHFDVPSENSAAISSDTLILVDMWARKQQPDAIYADITWMAYVGDTIPEDVSRVFEIVLMGRDAALQGVKQAFTRNQAVTGADVDRLCRDVIERNGFGSQFIHRTGHSLGQTVHGPGANIDSLESEDDRKILPSTGFTIEPGIYLPGRFGVRSEINVVISAEGAVDVSGCPIQTQCVKIPVYD